MTKQGFYKEEFPNVKAAVNELFEALPKSRRLEYLGHLNTILLYVVGSEKFAPSETQ